jgi:sugar fermentation stimulation protein A
MVREGHRAAIVLFVQRTDVDRFDAARAIDPAYAAELDRAAETGVVILPLAVRLVTSLESSGLWSLGWELPGLLPWVRRR